MKRQGTAELEDASPVSKKRHTEAEEPVGAHAVKSSTREHVEVAAEDVPPSSTPCKPKAVNRIPMGDAKLQQSHNIFYFEQYGDLSTHELMLRDRPRMEAYVRAIATCSDMEGKVVMDVGSGSGFLALVCAMRGKAKHVHAVEANTKMANIIRDLVHQNGLRDQITVWDCTVEALIAEESDRLEVTAASVENPLRKGSVDIIVSEWMGFYLFHEAMLESVLLARDHFLFGGETFSDEDERWVGKNILPRVCELFTAPLDFSRWVPWHESDYFKDLYDLRGFDRYFGHQSFPPGKTKPTLSTYVSANGDTEFGILPQDLLVTAPAKILTLDLMRTQTLRSFHFPNIIFPKSTKPGLFGGVGVWFDCVFTDRSGAELAKLQTGPEAPPTHWRQTIVDFGDVFPVEAGETFAYELRFVQCLEHKRFYDITLST